MSLLVDIKLKIGDFTLDINFENTKKTLGILGASGCGKSMTLKCIAGIITPDEGRIVLGERILYDSNKKIDTKVQDRNIGFLFQDYALFPNMNVEQNIAAGIKGDKELKRHIVAQMINKFRLEGKEKLLPGALSGGQQQRVALARILAYNPELILLDEPFSAMDTYLRDQMQQQLLETLSDYDGDVILVSHDRDEIYKFCSNMIIMRDGTNDLIGDTKELFIEPKTLEAAKLSGCKNLSKVKKIDDYHILAIDWDIKLRSDRIIDDDITYVGIRAHDFIPVWDDDAKYNDNCIKCDIKTTAEMPFEVHFYIKASNDQLCWFIQRDLMKKLDNVGKPKSLYFPPEKLLLLRK